MTDTHQTYDLMRELMRENPDLSERTLICLWRNTVLDDPDMTNGVLDLAGLHIYNAVLSQTEHEIRKAWEAFQRAAPGEAEALIRAKVLPEDFESRE